MLPHFVHLFKKINFVTIICVCTTCHIFVTVCNTLYATENTGLTTMLVNTRVVILKACIFLCPAARADVNTKRKNIDRPLQF